MPAIPDRDILPLTNRIKNRIRKERKHIAKQKERFVEVYSQGLTNVDGRLRNERPGRRRRQAHRHPYGLMQVQRTQYYIDFILSETSGSLSI